MARAHTFMAIESVKPKEAEHKLTVGRGLYIRIAIQHVEILNA